MNQIFVQKKCLANKSNPWITSAIKVSCKKKRILYQQKNRGQIGAEFYNKYCNILKNVIKEAKKMSNKKYIEDSENKTKASWNLVKKITGKNTEHGTILEYFSEKYRSPSVILNKLNDYFINECESIQQNYQYNFNQTVNPLSIFLSPTNNDEISKCIKNLRTKNLLEMIKYPLFC